MQSPSTVTQEPAASSSSFGFFTRLTCLASRNRSNPDGYTLSTSNALFFNGSRTTRRTRKALASLSLNAKSSAGSSLSRFINEFNSFMRFHSEKVVPDSFASIGVSSHESGARGNDGGGVLGEEGLQLSGVEADRPKKVLILMSDTGGGHRASAEAIRAAFNQEYGDEYQVFITDLWTDHTPWPFNQLPRSYNFLVKHGALWKMTYYGTAPRVIHQSNFAATSTFIAREIAQGLMKYQPDIIISVHPLMQHVPLRVLRSKGLLDKIVFTTVITDLSTCHPTWLVYLPSRLCFRDCMGSFVKVKLALMFRFHKLVTRCYCPSTEVAKRAQKAGLQTSQIKVYGLPVRPSFVKPVRPKVELRRELGMDENLPAVLLMGGGEGMGPIEATARALGDALYDENLGEAVGQVLIICGRNKKLQTRLSSIDWKIPVQVKGFVTKMEECMGACNCIITKAGPGTIAEAMIRGLPIILNGYIAGQEAGNVPYVVENGCGKFSKSPKEISKIVADWFGPGSKQLEIMSQNALRLARPEAVFKIVQDMHELVRQRNYLPQLSCTA
ncbi:monogalactosyldiacylglycerol synthase 1, chloroplastic isoform X1 [Brassica rapa]|uniref:monogalactosyldiacylglycerol synthase 1, chloroplastic isoform X1 n=1 Tax=Brassica campestris TaxID=3711 RepID=UPI00142E19B1|nr:monogalactosyldiacylglycerol synthase 1, chloroplastic isoform X1 [Brassica rapa]